MSPRLPWSLTLENRCSMWGDASESRHRRFQGLREPDSESHRRNQKRWAREGSTRTLPTQEAIHAAVRYVAEGQGAAMAVYVWHRGAEGG